jgi:hypothetical protein
MDAVFAIANALALLGWGALLLAPWRRVALVRLARFAAAAIAGVYATLVLRGLLVGPGLPEEAGFTSLAGVVALLAAPGAILGAWVHLLAFDLFVGSWIAADAEGRLPHGMVVPCLLLCFLAGPLGLLLYLLLRAGVGMGVKRTGQSKP